VQPSQESQRKIRKASQVKNPGPKSWHKTQSGRPRKGANQPQPSAVSRWTKRSQKPAEACAFTCPPSCSCSSFSDADDDDRTPPLRKEQAHTSQVSARVHSPRTVYSRSPRKQRGGDGEGGKAKSSLLNQEGSLAQEYVLGKDEVHRSSGPRRARGRRGRARVDLRGGDCSQGDEQARRGVRPGAFKQQHSAVPPLFEREKKTLFT
jgi:hypothetical protein